MTYRIAIDTSRAGDPAKPSLERCEFEIAEAAIAACENIIEQNLLSLHQPGMTAEQLFDHYLMLGEIPYLRTNSGRIGFSACDYAMERCKALCAGASAFRERRRPVRHSPILGTILMPDGQPATHA